MSVIDQLRAIGLSMGSVYAPITYEDEEIGAAVTTRRYRSVTTDEAKANAATDLGVTVIPYRSSDERFHGWEITANVVEDE